MSIEDVKQWSDLKLDSEINELTDADLSPSINLEDAREVQAKAIEVNAEGFVCNLINIMDEGIFYTNDGFDLYGVSKLLQATPRQISEAAYLTLKG